MKNFRLYDNKEKNYLNSVNYNTLEWANTDKEQFLSEGNYPDDPHTVISVHEFNDNDFVRDATWDKIHENI